MKHYVDKILNLIDHIPDFLTISTVYDVVNDSHNMGNWFHNVYSYYNVAGYAQT